MKQYYLAILDMNNGREYFIRDSDDKVTLYLDSEAINRFFLDAGLATICFAHVRGDEEDDEQ